MNKILWIVLLSFLNFNNVIAKCQKGNCLNGEGTYIYSNGDKYVGEYKEGKKNGQGTYYTADGGKYVGEFKNDASNGQGTFYYADGGKYVGEWKNDSFNGQGTFYYANGGKYVGEYKEGKMHGQATFFYANGDKYVGEFKEGKFNGQGTYSFASGEKYVGEFKEGKFNGQGTFYTADGYINYIGEWANGEKKSNEPKFCNRNRFLFCEAQQLIEWCGTIEKVSLFNKCMEGVDEIALALEDYYLSKDEIVMGLTYCDC